MTRSTAVETALKMTDNLIDLVYDIAAFEAKRSNGKKTPYMKEVATVLALLTECLVSLKNLEYCKDGE